MSLSENNEENKIEEIFPSDFCKLTEQIVESLANQDCFTIDDYIRWKAFKDISIKYNISLDLFRNIEYLFTDKELDLNKSDILLDIGTGRSVFPRYLLRNFQIPLTICDYDNYGFDTQKYYFDGFDLKKITLHQADASKSGLKSESFTKISAISAIEHFLDNSDSEFIKEAYRLLKPGGSLVVTVPYSHEYREDENVPYYHGGFERRYNEKALKERIFSAAPFKIKTLKFMNPQNNDFIKNVIEKYNDIGVYFGKWYENENYIKKHLDSIWFTLLCIKFDSQPTKESFACCFSLIKEEKSIKKLFDFFK